MHGPLFAIAEAGYQWNDFRETAWAGNFKVGAGTTMRSFQHSKPGGQRGTWGWYAMADQLLIPFGDDPEEGRGLGVFGTLTGATDTKRQIGDLFFTAGLVRVASDSRPRMRSRSA
jgi:hypothetical protein